MATAMTRVSPAAGTMASSPMSDEEVVKRVRAGETALFEILMRRHNQRLYRAARAILGNDGEAEGVMQEAYVRAYIHLEQFDGRAKFSTWLTKIERQKIVEIDATSGSTEGPMSLQSKEPSPEQEVLTHTMRIVLEAAIDRLPETYRSVFMLREIEGLNTAETAQCLEIGEDAVKVRLHRARALMRKDIYAQTGAASTEAFQFLGHRCDRMVAAVLGRISSLKSETGS
jgi:RNA polymerase sigma-70 factor, ECF subfamily